jgi:hypothetical protein
MALSKTVLGPLLKSKIDLAIAGLDDPNNITSSDRDAIMEAMADAIITHIKTAGVVSVVSVSGVTTGAGVSGPGTGTIS